MDPAWAPWLAHPEQAGLLLDFDGTLSAIVDDAADARPLPGVVEALRDLAARYRVVAVLSGRPVAFLADQLTSGVVLSGQYGLEERRNDLTTCHPDIAGWRDVIASAADSADAELPAGVSVERKGLSVTLHVRVNPEHDAIVRAWATRHAEATGLRVHRARRSWELRPPLAADKGTVVNSLAAGLSAVCYVGDDRGDLPAFEALTRLAQVNTTVKTRKVAVNSDEVAAELLAAADEVVDGPDGVLALLQALRSERP